jgi:aryl-alcohol dehydrogenase-like predicted oxidoreductase
MSFADPLPLSRYVYGSTRLGDAAIPFEDRVAMARAAVDAGIALHTSDQYGDALKVLKAAFDENRSHVPVLIFKIGWDSVGQVRDQVLRQLEAVGIDSMSIGQLCLGGALADDFRTGGSTIDELNSLKSTGLVRSFVLETWPWSSAVPLDALREGHAGHLIDALIFYLNPMQRFVTNELWDWIVDHETPVVAMRTVCGGNPRRMLEHSSSAPAYLKTRAAEIIPIFDRTGLNWTEFCVRFALGFSFVRATVGATSKKENLNEFLAAAKSTDPLPGEVHAEILDLQRRWSEEHDRLAEPWSM